MQLTRDSIKEIQEIQRQLHGEVVDTLSITELDQKGQCILSIIMLSTKITMEQEQ